MFMVTVSVDFPVCLGTLTGLGWALDTPEAAASKVPVTSDTKRSTTPVLGDGLIPFIFKNRLYILEQF